MDRLFFPYHSPLSLAVVGVMSLVGLVLYAWRVRSVAGVRDRLGLLGLRLLAIGGILGAYLQFGTQDRQEVRRKGTVAVLVDVSASMDDGRTLEGTPRAQVQGLTRDLPDWWKGLSARWDLRFYEFARGLREVPAEEAGAGPAWGGATDLFGALGDLAGSLEGLAGVLLLSDGAVTDAEGEVLTAEAWALRTRDPPPVPVAWLRPSGPAGGGEGAFLSSVEGLSYLVVRDASPIRVRVGGIRESGPPLRLSIREGSRVLATVEVPGRTGAGEAMVEVPLFPRKVGDHVYEVRLEGPPEALSPGRSRRWVTGTVVRDSLQVLLLAGQPSWDVRFLRGWFRSRPGMDLVSFVTLRSPDSLVEDDEETTLVPLPARDLLVRKIEGFDLVILQNEELRRPDAPELVRSLEQHVRAGGALWVIGGDLALGAGFPWPEHLESLLPVRRPASGRGGLLEGEFQVEMVPGGRRHPALRGLRRLLASAPPLTAVHSLGGPTPEASVLLRTQAPGTEARPVLVTASRGQGRVALLATDTLWRWAAHPAGHEAYEVLLRGLVAWLTQDPQASDLRVRLTPREGLPGTTWLAEVETVEGVRDVRVAWERQGEDGSEAPLDPEVPLDLDPRQRAQIARVVTEEGPVRVRVTGVLGDQVLESEALGLVRPGSGERDAGGPSGDRLASWVRASGGLVAPMASPPDPDRLPFPVEEPQHIGVSRVDPLWNHPLLWLLLVAILMAEWYLERKIGYT